MEFNLSNYTNRSELDAEVKRKGNPASDYICGTEEELIKFNLSPKRTVFGVRIIQI